MASAHSPVVSSVRAVRSSSGKLIVDIETGQAENRIDDNRDSAAAELGKKGGKARAEKLSAEDPVCLCSNRISMVSSIQTCC